MKASKNRISWEKYFMNIAHEVATRSTCERKHVGSVIVRGKTILATGYNGSIRGAEHCDCLLYTSPSPRDATLSRMPSSA